MTFSASEAAFEGFRIVRRRPLAVLVWALTYIAAFALGFLIVGKPIMAMMHQIEMLQGNVEPTMTELKPLLGGYAAIFGVIWPLSILLGAVLSAAIARAVVQPKASRFGYLRLGKDELRVFGATVVLFLLLLAYYMVAVGVCVALGVFAHLSGQSWIWLFCGAAGIGALLGLIWLVVRLSLVVPIIVAENRFSLFDSFKLTKGRFWPLLGMGLLAFVMMVIVSLLGMIIALPLRLSLAGPFAQMQEPSEFLAVIQQHIGLILVWVVINAVISALQMAVIYAPFSAAYRAIKGVAASSATVG